MTAVEPTKARWTLGDLFFPFGRFAYDWMYRRGAPWEGSTKPDFVELLTSGRLSPETLGARALDIGCGIGDDSRLLALHGFDVCGVDLSPVAIDRARGVSSPSSKYPRFVVGDLLNLPDAIDGPFDLLVDIGTLDDFPRRRRPQAAAAITSLARTGSKLYLWCFFGRDDELPAVSFDGASRYLAPGEPRELDAPFGTHWEIEPAATGDRWASFLLTHR